jgi:RHS repeat-associated protein
MFRFLQAHNVFTYFRISIWSQLSNNNVFYHHSDHLGTSELISDSLGNVVWHADYDAFGNLLNVSGYQSFAPFFTGKFFDKTTGLYYFNARWYHCELGRFSSQDPARDGMNWWAYCRNNPLKYVDPTGMYNEENGYSKQEIKDFKKMNVQEQLSFLKTEVSSVTEGSTSAGTKSFYMRTQLKKFMNLEDLFNSRDGDEKFMNEDLRDFLNIKEDGSDYIISDMSGNGWKRLKWPADSEHQNIQNGGRNIKFVNEDGREAIFDSKGNFIKDTIDKGTFNYGKPNWYPASTHGRYDMKPFFRQNNIQP